MHILGEYAPVATLKTMRNSKLPIVFILEDHPVIRRSYQNWLKNFHIQTAMAVNVRQAFQYLRFVTPNYFDLIILDLELPDGDGLEVCRSIRSNNDYNANIPILVFSSTSQERKKECLTAGCNEVYEKPQARDFLAIVKYWIYDS